jgi:hypothetical protein
VSLLSRQAKMNLDGIFHRQHIGFVEAAKLAL